MLRTGKFKLFILDEPGTELRARKGTVKRNQRFSVPAYL